jgi:hypothetical protein
MVRAALLDENGVYLRMDTLADPGLLTSRHLPQITACDLPPGKYRWIAHGAQVSPEIARALGSMCDNECGGAFVPINWLERVEQDARDVLASAEAMPRLQARRTARKVDRERGR